MNKLIYCVITLSMINSTNAMWMHSRLFKTSQRSVFSPRALKIVQKRYESQFKLDESTKILEIFPENETPELVKIKLNEGKRIFAKYSACSAWDELVEPINKRIEKHGYDLFKQDDNMPSNMHKRHDFNQWRNNIEKQAQQFQQYRQTKESSYYDLHKKQQQSNNEEKLLGAALATGCLFYSCMILIGKF